MRVGEGQQVGWGFLYNANKLFYLGFGCGGGGGGKRWGWVTGARGGGGADTH